MRFAVISDVQGNLTALDAVLADIERRFENLERVISTGDVVGRGPHPNEVVERFRSREIDSVRGNYDDAVVFDRIGSGVDFATREEEETDAVAVAWTRQTLRPENMTFLREMPRDMRLHPDFRGVRVEKLREDERTKEYRRGFLLRSLFGGLAGGSKRPTVGTRKVLVAHGSPRALNEFIRADTANSILATIMRDTPTDVLITGHAGESFERQAQGVHFVGVGGVSGVNTGSTAQYAVLDVTDKVKAEFCETEYDLESYLRDARASGLPAQLSSPVSS